MFVLLSSNTSFKAAIEKKKIGTLYLFKFQIPLLL